MGLKSIITAAAAASLVAAPAMAAPRNAAASLSVVKSARAGASAKKSNDLAGAGLLGLIIGAGVAAIGAIAIVNGDDGADSN